MEVDDRGRESEEEANEPKKVSGSDFIEDNLLPTFKLADRLMVHEFMNRLIDLLQDFQHKKEKYFRSNLTLRVFEEVGKWSKLQLYFTANFAAAIADGIEDHAAYTSSFTRDMKGKGGVFIAL